MTNPLTRSETGLSVALILACALAGLGPAVAQYADYHAFADQRTLWRLPFAMDVLSNIPFALLGAWGLLQMGSISTPRAVSAISIQNTKGTSPMYDDNNIDYSYAGPGARRREQEERSARKQDERPKPIPREKLHTEKRPAKQQSKHVQQLVCADFSA